MKRKISSQKEVEYNKNAIIHFFIFIGKIFETEWNKAFYSITRKKILKSRLAD